MNANINKSSTINKLTDFAPHMKAIQSRDAEVCITPHKDDPFQPRASLCYETGEAWRGIEHLAEPWCIRVFAAKLHLFDPSGELPEWRGIGWIGAVTSDEDMPINVYLPGEHFDLFKNPWPARWAKELFSIHVNY